MNPSAIGGRAPRHDGNGQKLRSTSPQATAWRVFA